MRDTFRKFRLSFYVYIAYILAALFYGITAALLNPKPIIASNTSQIIIVIFAIIFLVAWFLFLFNLSKLATAARKNAALWVIGAVFFILWV